MSRVFREAKNMRNGDETDRIVCTGRRSSMRNFGTNFLERINFMRQRRCLNIYIYDLLYIIIVLYLIYNYIVNCARDSSGYSQQLGSSPIYKR